MEFNPLITEEDGLGDNETTPLDGAAGSPDDEDNEGAVHEGSGHEEDPDA